jgi:hypothetical protein
MKPIRLTRHARDQARERGATEAEVQEAVTKGAREPAKRGRWFCRYNFGYGKRWQGKMYAIKQVAPIIKGSFRNGCHHGLHVLFLKKEIYENQLRPRN